MLGSRVYSNSKLDTVPTVRKYPVYGGDIEPSYKCIYNCELCYEEKVCRTMTDYSMGPNLGWGWLVILKTSERN